MLLQKDICIGDTSQKENTVVVDTNKKVCFCHLRCACVDTYTSMHVFVLILQSLTLCICVLLYWWLKAAGMRVNVEHHHAAFFVMLANMLPLMFGCLRSLLGCASMSTAHPQCISVAAAEGQWR